MDIPDGDTGGFVDNNTQSYNTHNSLQNIYCNNIITVSVSIV